MILASLHQADNPSLLPLEFMAQGPSNRRRLIIGLYREVDHDLQRPLAETMEHLDFAIGELRDTMGQPALERSLRHRDILKA